MKAAEIICAEVKIEIRQKVSLERQAFDAELIINNATDLPISQLTVEIGITDELNAPVPQPGVGDLPENPEVPYAVNGAFFVRAGEADAATSVGGTWSVAAQTSAKLRWLMIPLPATGGQDAAGKRYRIGATIRYKLGSQADFIETHVVPEIITVLPQPLLQLDYFLPGDVFGLDPLDPGFDPNAEPEPEPVVALEPFTLGLRVRNVGHGAARALSVETAQPRFLENETNLAVAFDIIGSHVDDAPTSPSLLIDFGDVAPGAARMGRWTMTSSLTGTFTEFNSYFTHAAELGGALTSLITATKTHRLVKDVRANDGSDTIKDFLARADLESDAYYLFRSLDPADGRDATEIQSDIDANLDEPVTHQFDQGLTLDSPSSGQPHYLLTVDDPGTSPLYARLQLGGVPAQARQASARRYQAEALPPDNVWISKARDPNDPVNWLYYLNLFDVTPSEQYEILLDAAPASAAISGIVFVDANNNGTQDAGDSVLAHQTVKLVAAQTDAQSTDFACTDPAEERCATTDAQGAFRLTELPPDTYTLFIAPDIGFENGAHTPGVAGGVVHSDRISGIRLLANADAGGYAFARRFAEVLPVVSDLGIAIVTAPATPVAGRTFDLTVTLFNVGPDAADAATAAFAWPAEMEILSRTVSAGEVSIDAGAWSPGPLENGASATLSLEVRMPQWAETFAASGAVAAAVGSDPNEVDNVFLIASTLASANLPQIAATIASRPRVLVLCNDETAYRKDTQAASSNARTKATDCPARELALSNFLGESGIHHAFANGPQDFVPQVRSGQWNVYWFAGGIRDLPDEVWRDLRELVIVGHTVVFDGLANDMPSIAGVADPLSFYSAGGTIHLPHPMLPTTIYSVPFLIRTLQLSTATGVGFNNGVSNEPLWAVNTIGAGRVFTSSPDIMAVAAANPSQSVLTRVLDFVPPAASDYVARSTPVEIAIRASTVTESYALDLAASLPAGSTVQRPFPTPQQALPGSIEWARTVSTSQQFLGGFTWTPPLSPSLTTLQFDGSAAFGDDAFELQPDTLQITSVDVEKGILNAISAAQDLAPVALAEAIVSLNAAAAAYASDDLPAAREHLFAAGSAIDDAIAPEQPLRRMVAVALQSLLREWDELPACLSTGAVTLPGVDGFSVLADAGFTLRGQTTNSTWWEAGVGTQATPQATSHATWSSGSTYDWSVTFNRMSGGSYSVNGSGTRGTAGSFVTPGFDLHNGVWIRATRGTAANVSSVAATVATINGSPVSISLPNPAAGSATSSYLMIPGVGNSLTVTGTFAFGFTATSPGDELRLFVGLGQVACRMH